NEHRGKLRSTFDLQLAQTGTYRIAVVNDGVFARWKEDGKPKRYFGKAEGLAQAVPAQAQDLEISQSLGRVETFVTSGKPSPIKPVGRGLELVAVTHPNDLYSDEAATFQMTVDGKPAAGLEVTVVPDGSRYRDKVDEMALKTDAQGKFQVKWPQPGMYWLEASLEDQQVTVPKASKRRLSYAGTLEVLRP
ncbi:PF10670 domain protein, partial [Bordetella hinzii CA90 BAL1384]